MKKQTADKLVERLGMEPELTPLLDSNADYARFEGVILGILDKLKGTRPIIVVQKKLMHENSSQDYMNGKPVRERPARDWISSTYKSRLNTDEAIECFKRKYGVGCDEQRAIVIARELGIVTRCAYGSSQCAVVGKAQFVSEVLRQYHKWDIWYGTQGLDVDMGVSKEFTKWFKENSK